MSVSFWFVCKRVTSFFPHGLRDSTALGVCCSALEPREHVDWCTFRDRYQARLVYIRPHGSSNHETKWVLCFLLFMRGDRIRGL